MCPVAEDRWIREQDEERYRTGEKNTTMEANSAIGAHSQDNQPLDDASTCAWGQFPSSQPTRHSPALISSSLLQCLSSMSLNLSSDHSYLFHYIHCHFRHRGPSLGRTETRRWILSKNLSCDIIYSLHYSTGPTLLDLAKCLP